ncbi:unnamed protein product [Ectocarpus sp. CCAP 1310/34]|nr:unnamed protein product [Ectocarpus sp. CCAP 1310/34]
MLSPTHHGLDFGIVKEESDSRTARYLIQSCGYRALCKDSLGWLPEDWYFGRDQTGGLLLHTTLGGARIQVCKGGAPSISAAGEGCHLREFNKLIWE